MVTKVGADIGSGNEDVSSFGSAGGNSLAHRLRKDLEPCGIGIARSGRGGNLFAADDIGGPEAVQAAACESVRAGRAETVAGSHERLSVTGRVVERVSIDELSCLVSVGCTETGIVIIEPLKLPAVLIHLTYEIDFLFVGYTSVETGIETCISRGVEPCRRCDAVEVVDYEHCLALLCLRYADTQNLGRETASAGIESDNLEIVKMAFPDRNIDAVSVSRFPDIVQYYAIVKSAVICPRIEDKALGNSRRLQCISCLLPA